MKGDVNVWTNLKTITINKEFRPLRIAMLSQLVFLFFIVQFGVTVFYKHAAPAYAATYTFTQSSWSGSASTTATGLHPGDATGWTYYYSASSTISAGSDVRLSAVTDSFTKTSDTDFGGATTSSVEVSGSGDSASVVLTSTADEIYDWIQPDGGSSTSTVITDPPVDLGSSQYVGVKYGNYMFYIGDTGSVYRYDVSGNSWDTMSSQTLNSGDSFYMPGTKDTVNGKVYFLAQNDPGTSYAFYSYDLATDTWGTLHNSIYGAHAGWAMYISPEVGAGTIFAYYSNNGAKIQYDIETDLWTFSGAPGGSFSRGGRNSDGTEFYLFSGGIHTYDGATWTTITSTLPSLSGAVGLIHDKNFENFYYYNYNTLYQYNISLNQWAQLSGHPAGTTSYSPILFASDEDNNYIYAIKGGSYTNFHIFDVASSTWTQLVDMPNIYPYHIEQDPENHAIYYAAYSTGKMYKYVSATLTYDTPGTYTSAVIDNGSHAGYTTMDYTTTLNSQTVTLDVRAGDSTDTGDGSWTSWTTGVASGGDISALGTHRYIQYRANLSTSDITKTPTLDDITVNFNTYTSGEVISSPYDSYDAANVLAGVSWTGTTSTDEVIKFQLRTSADGASWTDWMGTDGTSSTYFTASDGSTDISGIDIGDGTNDQWIQYQAFLTSAGAATPILSGVTMTYVVNATPEVQTVTAVQNSDGTVSISYEVRDTDTLSGGTPGTVLPTIEYWNGSTWIEASTLSADATSTKAVNESTFTAYSLTWYPDIDFDEQYLNSSTGQIRVKANDSEAANNIGSGLSATFALDTKKPIKTSFSIDARTGISPNLTLVGSDDTMAGLEILMSNASTALGADGTNASSGIWMAYTTSFDWTFNANPNTVYYQFRDATGNTSTVYTSTAPQTPQNPVYRDISNSETSEWREFVAWETVELPTPGFKQYNIYRDVDGAGYSLVSTQTDRSVNYYLDTGLTQGSTYSYKITAEDSDDNVSDYSSVVSDAPDGQGGSDFTSPTISNVASSAVGPQTATITWDTDEPSDSTIEYITVTGGDFSTADSIGIATMLDTTAGLGQHTVVLTNLQPNTTYYYQVKSTDPSTNLGTSKDGVDGYSFTTLSGPTISEISVTDVANQSATISWQTDSAATSYVYYSTTTNFSSPTQTGSVDETTSHAVTVSNLTADTQYYYYVQSGAASDKNVVDGQITYYSFITTNDATAPTITFNSNTDITNLSDTGVTISWTTDQSASSTLEYGTTDSYGTTEQNNNYNTNHTYTLSSLTLGTTYYVRLKNTDANQNTSTSTEFTFTTTDSTDITAPTITSVTTTLVSDIKAVITWTTDEGSSSQVLYGTTSDTLTSETTNDTASNLNHTVVITGLTANTPYYYIVKSADANGNTTTSTPTQTFTTTETLSTETEVTTRED
ncbi:MAG: hypothetical protein COU34_03090, partial [Candidatus Magasanikbacteria bacterium CG10_big_fil_rev_8_21_14_0_10_43_9]